MWVEHEGARAESTDQRIQKLLRNKAKQKEADELKTKLAEEQNNERQATAEHVRQKWVTDTHIIAEILKDFEQKMSALGLQLTFQDAGQKGDALAVGRITGRVSGSDLQVTLNVDPTGEIHALAAGLATRDGGTEAPITTPTAIAATTPTTTQLVHLIPPPKRLESRVSW